MSGRSVLDEAIAGSGELGTLHHELEALQHALADPARAGETGRHPRAVRPRAGGLRAGRRLRPRVARAGDPARARVRGPAGRRRRRCAVGRLEDARGPRPHPARPTRRPAAGRAHQPPRHRVHPVARAVRARLRRHRADDLPRQGLHEPRRGPHPRDRRRRVHELHRRLRLLRARARHRRGQPRGGVRAPAGHVRQGEPLHRALLGARRQGRAGAEPGEEAREDRAGRAAAQPQGGRVRVPPAAALGRGRAADEGHPQGLRRARGVRRPRLHRSAAPSAGA